MHYWDCIKWESDTAFRSEFYYVRDVEPPHDPFCYRRI
jgi:hypothetical protein